MPARGAAAVSVAIRFVSASIIRCRSASLAAVRPNHRLPVHPSMRRAPAMPHSARSLPPDKRHSRLTVVRRGCNRCRIAGIHGEAMYTAPDCAACAALQASDRQCRGSRGPPLAFSWGFKGAILSRERMAPLPAHPCGTQGIPVPQRDKTFLAKGPITPPAALPTVITSRYKTARPLHAPPIVK